MQKIDFYFSFRSPYAWIAYKLLAQTLTPSQAERLNFLPYWEPRAMTLEQLRSRNADFLYQPMTKEKHLYILQDVKRITQALQWKHVWPIDRNAEWELAILAYLAADRMGHGPTYRDAVYAARWERGLDIHQGATLELLAQELAMDVASFNELRGSEEIQAQATSCLERAWQAGVFGIPFFVAGREKYWGIDRLSAVIKILKSPPAEQRSHTPPSEKPGTNVGRAMGGWVASGIDASVLESVLDIDWQAASCHWDSDAAGGCG